MSSAPRIVIATDYPEGAITALARGAEASGHLEALYTTFYSARWRLLASLSPPGRLRRMVNRRLERRRFPKIDPAHVRRAATLPQLVHAGVARLGSPVLTTHAMYWVKERFDDRVAVALRAAPYDIVIGMYGASAKTLEEARRARRLSVLNFVNSYPAFHNEFLREAGVPATHHEMMPAGVARRVDREIHAADLILVPSRFIERQLLSIGVPADRVAVEPYGVDLARFRPTSRERAWRPRVRCLFAGQVSHRKGVRVLLEAARRLHDVDFELVGPSVSAEVLRNSPSNVQRRDIVLPDGVARAMSDADIFLLPSIEDAYPLAVLEAMASGLPVVVTERVGVSELLTSGENGFVIPAANAAALADVIRQLADDAELRVRVGAAARQCVETAHSWEQYASRVLSRLGIPPTGMPVSGDSRVARNAAVVAE